METPWSSAGLWVTLGVAFVVVGGGSAFLQYRESESLNYKAITRDGLLASIFLAMAWVLLPDTMSGLVSSGSSLVQEAPKLSLVGGASSGLRPRGLSEFDLQVGTPGF